MTDSTTDAGGATVRPVRCVVAGGSLVGLSLAIALSELGLEVTVLERSPAPAIEVGGGLGVDIALLRQVTGIREEPPALHGIDRDTTAWHLLQGWLEAHAVRRPGVTVHRGTEVTNPRRLARGRSALAGDAAHAASPMVGGGFRQGLYDVRALSQVMAGLAAHGDVPGALGRYQRQRLGPAAQHVAISERATAAYLADAGARPAR